MEADEATAATGRGKRQPSYRRTAADNPHPSNSAIVHRAIRGAKEGDQDAIAFLYARYADDVCASVTRIIRDHHEAEDITQQVFAKLAHAITKYDERDVPFLAWLLRVARNATLDTLRRNRAVPVDDVRPTGQSDSQHAKRERLENLREALAALPPEQREVLALRHLGGYSPIEIATHIGRSESAVHGLHHRGRAAVKANLASRGCAPMTAGGERHTTKDR
jgi:RNA polymerase sigma-70 factor, ECF subfamily